MNVLPGLPGHPLHPPLTDVTLGSERNTATAWWLALVVGLVVTVPTALTGLLDWLGLERGTPVWRTATTHFAAMVTATVFFLLAAVFGHGGYTDGEVGTAGLVLTLVGYGVLAFGGFLGGTLVFVHGLRVLEREPSREATSTEAPEHR